VNAVLEARPYPAHFIETWAHGSGAGVLVRPASREDRALVARFLSELGQASHYQRHFAHGEAPDLALLERLEATDYRRHMALIAVAATPCETAIAHAEYVAEDGCAEFALVVADRWQQRGLGGHLLRRLMRCAGQAGLQEIHGHVLASNEPMIRLVLRSGFKVQRGGDARLVRISRTLETNAQAAPLAPIGGVRAAIISRFQALISATASDSSAICATE